MVEAHRDIKADMKFRENVFNSVILIHQTKAGILRMDKILYEGLSQTAVILKKDNFLATL